MTRRYKWGNVVVVSDGLGSKPHSDLGSRAACLSVFEAAKSYKNNPEANIIDILRLIHANWLVKIAPFTPSECLATCLFAIQNEETITLGRLGDGMITVCGASNEDNFILTDDKEDSFSNYTDCLQYDFKCDQWETVTIDASKYEFIILCTDGISDDLLPERRIDFCKAFVGEYSKFPLRKRRNKITGMLNEWPVPGHSDDKTIACLFKKRDYE